MKDVKEIVAENIIRLRKQSDLTQAELARKLNYTDKAVSKWERGDSLPSIPVLMDLARLFSVKVDDLLTEYDGAKTEPTASPETEDIACSDGGRRSWTKASFVICIGLLGIWLLGVASFVLLRFLLPHSAVPFMAPVVTVPVSLCVWLSLNSVFRGGKGNYAIISGLMWTAIAATHVSLVLFGITSSNLFFVYLVGVPGQIMILVWKRLRVQSKRPNRGKAPVQEETK